MKAYLQHGGGTVGPFRTEGVATRHAPPKTERRAKVGPVASNWQVKFEGAWRRVFIGSGEFRTFITWRGEKIRCDCHHED